MLKRLSPDITEAGEVSASDILTPIDFKTLGKKMLRQKRYMLLGAASGLVLGLCFALLSKPLYTSSAKLLIEPKQPIELSQQPSGNDTIEAAYVDSQVEVLNSGSVLARVVQSRNLTQDPEYASPEPGFLQSLRALGSNAQAEPLAREALINKAIDNLRRQISVKRAGLTYVLGVSVTSSSPEKSADLANAVTEAFLADNLEARATAAETASRWLEGRGRELRELVVAADAKVQQFRASNNIVTTEKGLMSDQQVTEVSSQLTAAKLQLAEAKARYDKLGPDLTASVSGDMDIPADLPADHLIRKLQQQLIANRVRIVELAKKNGPRHASVQKLESVNDSLTKSMAEELRQLADSYRKEADVATERVAALEARLQGAVGTSNLAGSAQVELHDLEREAASYRAIYESTLNKLQEAVQQQTFPINNYRVITPAVAVQQKSWPKSSLTIGLATATGMLLGAGVALARAGRDSSLRDATDVSKALGGKLLANFPALRGYSLANVLTDPGKNLSEPARAVKLALRSSRSGDRCLVVGMMSSSRDEGCSFIAASVASSHALSGYRTLLVDADLQNAKLTSALAAGSSGGLRAALTAGGAPEVLAVRTGEFALHVLPAGARKQNEGCDWFSSASVPALMKYLREHYDVVILDLPPLSTSSDAAALSPFVDAFVHVAAWGKTQAAEISDQLREIDIEGCHLAGFVLTGAPPARRRPVLPLARRILPQTISRSQYAKASI